MRHKNRVVVLNSKGGVGKTTTTIEIAAHACRLKKRVLVVDVDPQANASKMFLGNVPDSKQLTVLDLLIEPDTDVREVIKKGTSSWENLHIIPANKKLESAPKHLEPQAGWTNFLDELIEDIEENFDLILIDTGPNTGCLTQMAVKAANKMIIPTDTSVYGQDGLSAIFALVSVFEKRLKHQLDFVKILLCAQHKGGAHSVRAAKEFLEKQYKNLYLKIEIPHCVKVGDGQRMDPPQSAMSLLNHDHKLFLGYEKVTKILWKGQ